MPPVTKRRKLEHSSSSDIENDTASSDGAASGGEDFTSESEDSQDRSKPVSKPGARPNGHQQKSDLTGMQASQTSLLQMQVAELLEEVTPNYASRSKKVVDVIKTVKRVILAIPSREPLSLAEAERSLKRASAIAIPFPSPRPSKDIKYRFAYLTPAAIDLVGSFDLQTSIRGTQDTPIDLHVSMPASLFEAKDYLDYRYFYKRDYYLACLAAGLQASEHLSTEVKFAFQSEHDLQPVILLRVKDSQGAELPPWSTIRLLLGPPPGFFRIEQLRPWMANIRLVGDADEADRRSGADPTPFYNGTLCSEILAVQYQRAFRSVEKSSPNFQAACRQIRVWLWQRGLGSLPSSGGFGGFEASAIVALMLDSESRSGVNLLAKDSGSFQIFRALIQLLASRDLVGNPLVLGIDSGESQSLKDIGLPALWDSVRGHNILFKMTTSSFARLRLECQLTLQALSQPAPWRFYPTFIAKVGGSSRYDYTFELQIPETHTLDTIALSGIHVSLERALSDRIREIYIETPLPDRQTQWPLKTKPTNPRPMRLLINLVANPENAARRLDLGPSAEEKDESADFREFWGKKAELRRYKDGSILESVTWPKFDDDVEAFKTIVGYMLEDRLGFPNASSVKLLGSNVAQTLPLLHMPSSQSVSPFKAANEAFAELEAAVRAASGQPLHIRQIVASSPGLRYSAIYPTGKQAVVTGEAILDVILQYEGSVRWPDDLAAIQRTKIALLLKLAELLETRSRGLSSSLGLENEHQDLLNIPFLDISLRGHLFRLRIHHDREATLLERQVKDKSASHVSRTKAATALSTYKRTFLQAPLHSQAISALCVRFPLLSPSIRLVKLWVSAHLLSPHFPSELLELIVVHIFTHPYPFPRPGSLQSSLLRTLSFLARWEWRTEPLLINVDPDDRHPVRAEAVDDTTTRFEAWRKVDPAMHRVAMFVASSIEPDGTAWSSPRPSPLAAGRLTALARAACAAVEAQNGGYGIAETGPLFSPCLADFDFVVYLDPKVARRGSSKALGADFESLTVGEFESAHEVAFNPVRLFIDELGRIHGDCIALFHDFGERPFICGVWNPQAATPRELRVGGTYNMAPLRDGVGAEGEVALNKVAVLNEIARLGGELVVKIVNQDRKA